MDAQVTLDERRTPAARSPLFTAADRKRGEREEGEGEWEKEEVGRERYGSPFRSQRDREGGKGETEKNQRSVGHGERLPPL